MKIISILACFVSAAVFCHAQNFFYIGNKNATEKSISEELVKASQYVTKSPLASNYIITASVAELRVKSLSIHSAIHRPRSDFRLKALGCIKYTPMLCDESRDACVRHAQHRAIILHRAKDSVCQMLLHHGRRPKVSVVRDVHQNIRAVIRKVARD